MNDGTAGIDKDRMGDQDKQIEVIRINHIIAVAPTVFGYSSCVVSEVFDRHLYVGENGVYKHLNDHMPPASVIDMSVQVRVNGVDRLSKREV